MTTAQPVDLVDPEEQALASDLIARAHDLIPLLARNAAAVEEARVVLDENIEALDAAGLFRLTQPRRYGGHEVSVTTFVRVAAELGRGCASTAWVVCLVNGTNWVASCMPDRARDEIWGSNPRARFCGVFSDKAARSRWAPGGQIVSGEWGFASASAHADWAEVAHPRMDEDGNVVEVVSSAIPMSELSIKDTWHVVGMAGTGSNTLVANEVFVPEHRTMSVEASLNGHIPNEHPDETLYRVGLAPFLALILLGPQLGIVQGGIDHVEAMLGKGRPIMYTYYEDSRTAPTVHLSLAQARSDLDAARLLVERGTSALDEATRQGSYPDPVLRARGRMDAGAAVTHLRAAMQHLLNISGAGSFAAANPLQRMWRDLETASRHAVLSPLISSENYGRAILQQPPITALV